MFSRWRLETHLADNGPGAAAPLGQRRTSGGMHIIQGTRSTRTPDLPGYSRRAVPLLPSRGVAVASGKFKLALDRNTIPRHPFHTY
jgi:hypothetical protein